MPVVRIFDAVALETEVLGRAVKEKQKLIFAPHVTEFGSWGTTKIINRQIPA